MRKICFLRSSTYKTYEIKLLPFCPVPIYFGKNSTDHSRFVSLFGIARKLSSRVTLMGRLARLERMVTPKHHNTETLYTAFLFIFYSTANSCDPVCCRSVFSCFLNSVLNHPIRVVTECFSLSTINHLPVFSNIHPSELCQPGGALFFCSKLVLRYLFAPAAHLAQGKELHY